MAILRPNFSSIYSSIYTDISTGIGNLPIAKFSVLGAVGLALARALDSVYGYINATFLQAVPYTATGSNLEAWAALWGIYRKSASSASGTITVTFNDAATIPQGSLYVGSNAVVYTTISTTTATSAGTQIVPVSTTQTGSSTNLTAGSLLTLSLPIANVVAAAVVGTMTGGIDAETDAALFSRSQVLRSGPVQGGAVVDYVTVAEAVPQVTRAWVNSTPNIPGTVVVFIMTDNNVLSGGFPVGGNGSALSESRATAGTGDQLCVANSIYSGFRPVTALVQVVAPLPYAINISITNTTPNTTATQAAVIAALQAELLSIGTPLGMTVYESQLYSPLVDILTSFNITIPTGGATIPYGYIPVVGTVNFS